MTDRDALTLTLYGEARGEPLEGLIGVAMVIRRRVLDHYWGDTTYAEVCLHPQQFSCWLDSQEILAVAEGFLRQGVTLPPALQRCRDVATATIAGTLADNTFNANHYLTHELWDSKGCPSWAKGVAPLRTLGNHVFLSVA